MYVSGLLMCYVGAEVINFQLKHSVLFVKEDMFSPAIIGR
jgi:hypothetical protein